jgi:threonine dehydrogenase-like Zn-dependent dehydrogenase
MDEQTMLAAVVERPGTLTVREVPFPEIGPYDAKCRLLYGATCSGTDQHIIAGRFPWPITYPTILGHESVGEVIATGAKVRHYQVGDLISRVGTLPTDDGKLNVNWGGFAQYGIAKDHRAMRDDELPRSRWVPYRIHQVIPSEIDPAAATMIITWRETLSTTTRLDVKANDRVLVIGSGGNGLAFVSHASYAKAKPIVMIGNTHRAPLAARAGATGYVDYKAGDVDEQLSALSPGGFDYVIDAVGKAHTADRVLSHLSPGGTLAIYGIDEYEATVVHPNRAPGTFRIYQGGYDEAEAHEEVVRRILEGALDASIWLDFDRVFRLQDIDRAIAAVRERRLVKALVRLDPQKV